jgi:hypothetical protein
MILDTLSDPQYITLYGHETLDAGTSRPANGTLHIESICPKAFFGAGFDPL